MLRAPEDGHYSQMEKSGRVEVTQFGKGPRAFPVLRKKLAPRGNLLFTEGSRQEFRRSKKKKCWFIFF